MIQPFQDSSFILSRRKFNYIFTSTMASMFLGMKWNLSHTQQVELTIDQVIDKLISTAVDQPFENTVDTVKIGDATIYQWITFPPTHFSSSYKTKSQ